MKKRFFFIYFFCLQTAFCFSAVPKWLTDLEKEYPTKKFIRVIGDGKTEEEAKLAAITGISAFFSESIESKTYAHSFKSETDFEYSSKSFISQDSITSTSSELFAVHYTQSYKNKKEKKYSICAYIDKEETFKIVSQKLSSHEHIFLQKKELIKTENDVLKKILFLNEALSEKSEIEFLYAYSQIVAPDKTERFNELIKLVNESKNDLLYLKRKNPVSVLSSGDFSEEIESIISEILTKNGFVVSKNSEYKINVESSFPIHIFNGIFYCTPTVFVFVESKRETVSSKSYLLEKKSAYNEQTVIKMSLSSMKDLLHERLIKDFLK